MSSTATESQHKCSCGRTFRHGISLKRHQKVSGCEGAETAVASETAPTASPVELVAPEPVPVPALALKASFEKPEPTVITAQQIALWQEQKNGDSSSEGTLTGTALSIDWDGVKQTCQEFVTFSSQQFTLMGKALGWALQLGARCVVFTGFLITLGYLVLFGISQDISASPAGSLDRAKAAEMAASSTVNSFLQTAQLQQFERAKTFLAQETRKTVSTQELQAMLARLPLQQAPESVSSALEQEGRVAKVTVVRAGSAEVYTLVQEAQGWGLASVALRRA